MKVRQVYQLQMPADQIDSSIFTMRPSSNNFQELSYFSANKIVPGLAAYAFEDFSFEASEKLCPSRSTKKVNLACAPLTFQATPSFVADDLVKPPIPSVVHANAASAGFFINTNCTP
jgi:hypothetical protein